LAEIWNGTSWSITPTPTLASGFNGLSSVSCTSATSCVAVGAYNNATTTIREEPLVESWDGTTWSFVASPMPNPSNASLAALSSVSCVSPSDCVAVGRGGGTSGLIETWDGTTWSIDPTPTVRGGQLWGLSCTSSSACIAVGDFFATTSASGNPVDGTLVETTGPAPPVVLTQPSNQSIVAGQGVSFTTTGDGNPSPTVRWQQSTDGGSTWSDIAGATSGTYNATNVPLSDNGFEFRAVFTSTLGTTASNAATLAVVAPAAPVVTTQPTSQSVPWDTNVVSFSAAASGEPAPTVRWQQSTDGGSTWANIPFATFDTYTILSVPLPDNGEELRAVFTNASGTATTNAVTLTVIAPAPPATSMLLPSNGATVSGSPWVDAVASSTVGIASVKIEVSGGSVSDQVVSSPAPTLAGYLGIWDTPDVPNGTYTLQSVATDVAGQTVASAPITVTVDNLPLQTAVLLPSDGATVSGAAYLDASANGTSDVTGVQFELSGGSLSHQVIATATATFVGWLVKWDTTTVPNGTYTLQSVATEVGGTTATSPGITVTVQN
jgi:hypothetical protein